MPSRMRSSIATVGAIALVALAAGDAMARAQGQGPEIRVADNVFVVPDKYAKTITGWLIVRAGCADEAETCNGIAHFLEHLLFINRDSDHRSKVSLFPSGNGNGWTTHTGTGYTQSFPVTADKKAADLDKLVGYLAGLLVDVRADETQAARERNIVLQEILQRGGSAIQAKFNEQRTALLLPNDPLGRGVGGTPETIKSFDVPRATAFQKAWYAVNNAAFIFTGPIGADDIKPLIDKHVASLAARPLPDRSWLAIAAPPIEVTTLRERDRDRKQPLVTYDKVVSYAEPTDILDQMTLNAARSIVGTFLASRMKGSPLSEMIDKTELIATGGFSVQRVRPGLMRIAFGGTPAKGVTPERLSAAVKAYVDKLGPGRVNGSYIQRLKSRSTVGRDLLSEEPSRYASGLVSWLSGPYAYEYWRDRAQIDDRIKQRHIDQVLQSIARPGREVLGYLLPAATDTQSKAAAP